MPFQIIDSPWYMVSVGIFVVISLLSFFMSYKFFLKKKQTQKKIIEKKEKSSYRKKGIAALEKKFKREWGTGIILLVLGSVCILCCFPLMFIKYKYGKVSEQFHPIKKYGEYNTDDTINNLFGREIREFANQEEWAESAAHLDWYREVFSEENNHITYADIKEYQTRVDNIHRELPYKEDMYIEASDSGAVLDESIQKLQKEEEDKLYNKFNAAVGVSIAEWDSEKLWEAYNAGKELSKKNNTSEMVFQTAVLAEGAHGNLYKESRSNENSLQYLAGAIESFEEFLEFNDRNPGDGTIVSVSEISFREGKMDYREGSWLKKEDNLEARHFLVKGYAEFLFSLENTAVSDKIYLTYLYYSGLSCLRIMSYIDDDKLKSDLCQQIIIKWDEFNECHCGDIENIPVENIKKERVEEVRKQLKSYCADENGKDLAY